MSDTRFAPVDAPERETLREPAKRWRNKWRAHFRVWCETTGSTLTPGIHWSPNVEPSREVAETRAQEFMDHNERKLPGAISWLGAHPVDESGEPL